MQKVKEKVGELREADGEKDDYELSEEDTKNKTVFISNIPLGWRELELKIYFSQWGEVEDVFLNDLSKTQEIDHLSVNPFYDIKINNFMISGVAHILFKDESSTKKLFSSTSAEFGQLNYSKIQGYLERYHSTMVEDPRRLLSETNEWMKVFDKKSAEEKEIIDALKGKPDEDGWIKVFEGGNGEVAPKPVKKKKVGDKDYLFYKVDKAKKKKDELLKLREQFLVDRQKIEKMKKERLFKLKK